jgi:ribosomal protein L40E
MKTCQNCGARLDGAAAFCEQCGTPAAQTCSGCGAPLEEGAAFCQNCGKPAETAAKQPAAAYQAGGAASSPPAGAPYPPAGASYQPAAAADKKAPKKFPVKVLVIAAAAVVVIAAVLIALFVLKPLQKSTLVYLKDDELCLTDLKKLEPFELTDDLLRRRLRLLRVLLNGPHERGRQIPVLPAGHPGRLHVRPVYGRPEGKPE